MPLPARGARRRGPALLLALAVAGVAAAAVAGAAALPAPVSGPAGAAGAAASTRDSAAASLQVLQQCVAATAAAEAPAEPDTDLAARCPAVARALADLGLAAQIDIGKRRLDSAALQDVLRMAQRYGAPMPSVAPNVAMLPLVLARLQTPPTPPRSWWRALEERIEQWLGQPGAAGADWLQQLLQQLSIPQWVLRVMLYATTAAVLLMAVWIIGRELRAAGLPGSPVRRARRAAHTHASAAPAPAAGPGDLAELEGSPLAERAILLLRLLVQALLRSGRLTSERALTYRELGERGAFDDAQQRGRFARLAHLAERDRYGAGALRSDEWPAVADEGRTLYAQLLAPRGPPAGGQAP